ncbi:MULTISPECIES: sugar kinase [unclassified Shinella]|uniref:tagatose kinase n=1 Tax=unclassified Shinella TaxID=2643062 RepID=UPI00225D3D7F|nr:MULTISPECIES: sugar kinase [unclassified Shinella]MCO5139247.1 sugar kinase [Shinella sp.]MDC7256024.1 sugar kinase [Shinella sp. YE25]CAI0338860.1 Tagatose kinase [Rhizobiaceae bacterium]CAK7257288.1 Tagatose kinase [Shinella sp. WSC3-e]
MRVSAVAPEGLGPTVTVGEILVEIMATTVGAGFLAPQPLVGPFASGAPAIFIDQVARFGGAAGIVAAVGADDFGTLNVERLRADGVDVSAIAVIPGKPTGSAFVRYRADGSRDFVYNIAHSAAGDTTMTNAARALIARAGHVHVMGSAFAIRGIGDLLLEAVASVRARGGSVSFDPNIRKELAQDGEGRKLVDDMLAVTDLLLPSGDELLVAAGEATEEAAVERLLGLGIGEVVLKRGSAGSSHFSRDSGRIDCPAFAVEEIDPTGAGDCFGATYLTGRRAGLLPAHALLYANAAGACAVNRQGPMEGVSSRQALDQFIAAAGREAGA